MLRQLTASRYVHDFDQTRTNAAATAAANITGFAVSDPLLTDLALSGAGRYEGAWFLIAGNEYRVASFNVASGALWTDQRSATVIPTGTQFEVHTAIGPKDKDRAVTETIRRIRVRQEIAIDGVTDRRRYSIDAVASPNKIGSVLDVYWIEHPSIAGSQALHRVVNWKAVMTASGHEVRIDPPIPSGMALIVDAAIEVSLGAADEATVLLPDDRWVVVGAAAQCLWQMERRTGPEGVIYGRARLEMEAEFKRLTAQFGAHGWAQGTNPDGVDGPPVAPSPATHEPF